MFSNFNFTLCNKKSRIRQSRTRQSRTSVQGWDKEVRLSFCSTTFIIWVLLSWLEYDCLINMMQMQRGQNCGYHSSLLPAPGDLYCHGYNNSAVLSYSVMSHSSHPRDYSLPGFSVCGDSPGKNTGVGCHVLLQGIFPTQGLNPSLPHCMQILYCLSYQGSPRMLEWVIYPISRGSSWSRNRTGLSCIAGRFFTSWATREAHQT